MGIKIGIGIKPSTTPGSSYEPELDIYIAGLITPLSDYQLGLLNNYILSIKAGFAITELSEWFDCMWFLAGETLESSKRNLIKRDHDITTISDARWVQYEGWDGGLGACILKTDYIPNTDAIRFGTTDNSLGCYLRKDRVGSNTLYAMGVTDNVISIGTFRLQARRGTNLQYGYNLSGSSSNLAVTDTLGMCVSERDGNTQYSKRNKLLSHADVDVPGNLPGKEMYLMLYNNNGGVGGYETSEMSFAFTGKYMDVTKLDCLIDSFEAYMDARGKGVLP